MCAAELKGKRVLVTRAREQASELLSLLRERGAEPVVIPTIEVWPPSDPGPLDRAVARAGDAYDWVAFTSANGVHKTWDAVVRAGLDARAFGRVRIAAVGPGTAGALEAHGLDAAVVAKESRGEGLAEDLLRAMGAPAGVRVLIPRARDAREALPDALRAAGCAVEVVVAYETRPPPPETAARLKAELEAGAIDAVTFTSGSTVENLCDLLGRRAPELLARTRVASIGPITTAACEKRGVRVDRTAHEATVRGLVAALEAAETGKN